MNTISTKELSEELSTRAGIKEIVINPHEEFKIITGQEEIISTGPAIILINED
jgi:hypothetical protein